MQSKYNVSFFENIFKTKDGVTTSFENIFNDIKNERFKSIIEPLRKYLNENNEALYKAEKKKLPAFTPSGTFKERKETGLIEHSKILSIDFDNLDNAAHAKAEIIKDAFVFAAFISPSNKGVKVFIKIEPESHKQAFKALQLHYKSNYKIDNDKGCSDLSRLCFVSMDKDIFTNFNCEVFKPQIAPIDYFTVAKNTTNKAQGLNKTNRVEKLIIEIEKRNIDITGDYHQWISIGFALANEYGINGEDYFHRISIFSPSYNKQKCTEQYIIGCNSQRTGITINSLFQFAKDFNILVNSKSTPTLQNDNEIIFYSPISKIDNEGNQIIKDIKINYVKFKELIYSFGYRRFDIDKDFIYIHLKSNVIKEVTKLQIQDCFFDYMDKLPNELSGGISKKVLMEKMHNNPQNFFCDNRLSLLTNREPFVFNEDTKNESFIYYKNGFVICNKDGYKLNDYSKLNGYIWHSQIIQRDFKPLKIETHLINNMSVYAQFMFNVSGKSKNNFNSLCTLVGYLLHGYTDVKMKAVILTDSRISEEANGRTGKTLFGNTLRFIKRLTQINGKDFDPTNKNKYQQANLDTQILFLNDARSNLRFEVLYNDITEGITVEKKNKDPFTLKVKMCITTNKTIAIEGSSSKDRSIEFEFADYYNEKYSPENEFKHRFFSDWSLEQWGEFDNFMMHCISFYFENGIIEPEIKNLNKRKLLEQTHPAFIEFINEKIECKIIVPGEEFCKQDVHNMFLSVYEELREHKYYGKLQAFSKWLKIFVKYDERFENVEMRDGAYKKYFTLKVVKK